MSGGGEGPAALPSTAICGSLLSERRETALLPQLKS